MMSLRRLTFVAVAGIAATPLAHAGCTISVTSSSWSDVRDSQVTLLEAQRIGRGQLVGCLTQAEHDKIGGANWLPAQFGPTPNCTAASPSDLRYTFNPVSPNCGANFADDITFTNGASGAIFPNASDHVQLGRNDDIDGLRPNGTYVRIEGPGTSGFSSPGIEIVDHAGIPSGNRIRNLGIYGFNGDGIYNFRADGMVLSGLIIGDNTGHGIHLGGDVHASGQTAINNQIGFAGATNANVIYGNGGDGIRIELPDPPVFPGSGNFLKNNFVGLCEEIDLGFEGCPGIGTNHGNHADGIRFINTLGDVIGGTGGDGNTIGRNQNAGLRLTGTRAVDVFGNRIGLALNIVAARPNLYGVVIDGGAVDNHLGGAGAGQGNVISGNTLRGVDVVNTGTTGNIIEGNVIGLNPAQTAALGNGEHGVGLADGSSGSIVRGNTLSANAQAGVLVGGSTGNHIENNSIGLRGFTGTIAQGNSLGIRIAFDSSGNTVGPDNRIAGNGGCGVSVAGEGSDGNVIRANVIGLGSTSGPVVPNGCGVMVLGGADATVVGGTAIADRNVISGNSGVGVRVTGLNEIGQPGFSTNGTIVRNNFVGTNSVGSIALGNNGDGIRVDSGAASTQVLSNLSSGNNGDGIKLEGVTGSLLQQNAVGTNANTNAALPNALSGVSLFGGSSGNSVGSQQFCLFAGNVIAGNSQSGVYLGGGATGNEVACNFIGGVGLGNANGVWIADNGNTIIGNRISGNNASGINVGGGVANALRSNLISLNANLGIDLGNDGVTANDTADADGGVNGRQNFPVLSGAYPDAGNASIGIVLESIGGQTYAVEVFQSTTCDGSGFGEGEQRMGIVNVQVPTGLTVGGVRAMLPTPINALLTWSTATATSPGGDTSEFGLCAQVSDRIFKDGFGTPSEVNDIDDAQSALRVQADDAESATPVQGLRIELATTSRDGHHLDVTVRVANDGPTTLRAPVFKLGASTAVVVERMDSSRGTCELKGRVRCTAQELEPGAIVLMTFGFDVAERKPFDLTLETRVEGVLVSDLVKTIPAM